MSLRPIDLQTMFMRMGELSKEQAMAQDAMAQKLAHQDARMAKLAKETAEKVTEPSEIPEGPDKVREDESRRKEGEGGQGRSDTDTNPDPENKEGPKEQLRESYLGTNIDIEG